MQKYTTRTTCRVCGSSKLKEIYSLGDICVSTFVNTAKDKTIKAPLTLVHCKECTLLQLKDTVDLNDLYKNHYWYKSNINPVIEKDLKEIAQVGQKEAKLEYGDIVLDIGANDGTLLKYVSKDYYRIGCEPAKNLTEELKKQCDRVIADFWSIENYQPSAKAKLITAIGMFYDCEDPNQFIGAVSDALAPNGVFIAQLMTLKQMIEMNDIGNVCHEHLEYYSYRSLVRLFEQNGLEIYKVEENSINGGSYRLFARHLGKGSIRHEEPFVRYDSWVQRLEKNRKDIIEFIRDANAEGREVWGLGASTKGNTIIQWCGLTKDHIVGVADPNPTKWNKLMVGSNIPIKTEDEARKSADYFWILPWGFTDSFVVKEKTWHKQGGKFIVNIPAFKVI